MQTCLKCAHVCVCLHRKDIDDTMHSVMSRIVLGGPGNTMLKVWELIGGCCIYYEPEEAPPDE